MRLDYSEKSIRLYNELTECSYYCNSYLSDDVRDLKGFSQWVQGWCADSGEDDIADVLHFSRQQRRHIRYQEGDVFRFKIGRRLYGYGRILLDYDKMRKKKEAFWDILMGKPLVCSVYHMVTDRKDVSVDELSHLGSLPSTIIADNALFYGEYEIIGNLPIGENEDYPVMYGNSISVREKALCYQCGKIYKKIEDGTEIYRNFRNNGVSFRLNLMLDVLLQCSEEASNTPYWTHYYAHRIDQDLRNPKHADKLQKVKEQMGL